MATLPSLCYAILPTTGALILVKAGESGYWPAPDYMTGTPDELNAELGVTKAQAAAMFTGSIFGWDVPGADPAAYDEDGKLIPTPPAANVTEETKVYRGRPFQVVRNHDTGDVQVWDCGRLVWDDGPKSDYINLSYSNYNILAVVEDCGNLVYLDEEPVPGITGAAMQDMLHTMAAYALPSMADNYHDMPKEERKEVRERYTNAVAVLQQLAALAGVKLADIYREELPTFPEVED